MSKSSGYRVDATYYFEFCSILLVGWRCGQSTVKISYISLVLSRSRCSVVQYGDCQVGKARPGKALLAINRYFCTSLTLRSWLPCWGPAHLSCSYYDGSHYSWDQDVESVSRYLAHSRSLCSRLIVTLADQRTSHGQWMTGPNHVRPVSAQVHSSGQVGMQIIGGRYIAWKLFLQMDSAGVLRSVDWAETTY
jgi:hypothetical protein